MDYEKEEEIVEEEVFVGYDQLGEIQKEHTMYPSRYKIGESVFLEVWEEGNRSTYKIPAYIRAITFTNSKVRYSVYLKNMHTTFHNIDSAFIVESPDEDEADFGSDNYS